MVPRQNCQLWKNLNGNSSEEHANILFLPPMPAQTELPPLRLSPILVLLANLLCDPDRDKHFPGGAGPFGGLFLNFAPETKLSSYSLGRTKLREAPTVDFKLSQ